MTIFISPFEKNDDDGSYKVNCTIPIIPIIRNTELKKNVVDLMLKETDKLLDPMTIYISFVTALYLLFTKKDYLKYKNQDIAQLLSDFLTFLPCF